MGNWGISGDNRVGYMSQKAIVFLLYETIECVIVSPHQSRSSDHSAASPGLLWWHLSADSLLTTAPR